MTLTIAVALIREVIKHQRKASLQRVQSLKSQSHPNQDQELTAAILIVIVLLTLILSQAQVQVTNLAQMVQVVIQTPENPNLMMTMIVAVTYGKDGASLADKAETMGKEVALQETDAEQEEEADAHGKNQEEVEEIQVTAIVIVEVDLTQLLATAMEEDQNGVEEEVADMADATEAKEGVADTEKASKCVAEPTKAPIASTERLRSAESTLEKHGRSVKRNRARKTSGDRQNQLSNNTFY